MAFWMSDGQVKTGMNVNVWDVADHIATLVATQVAVDTNQLADPDVDPGALAQQAQQDPAR